MDMMTNSQAITLCADDYGLAPGVSAAIRDLIAHGRLQATGCMTGSPHWPEAAPLLRPLEDRADVGVHFTLTDQRPLGAMPDFAPDGRFPPLVEVLKRAITGRFVRAEIEAELERQIDAFEAHYGRPPDFLDGHHHVHQLPHIGPIVLKLWARRLNGKGWIRSCAEPPLAILSHGVDPFRALVISMLGQSFRARLRALGVPHNRCFRGIYAFGETPPFAEVFRRATSNLGPKALMMVHPGTVDAALEAADSLTTQREREYAFLASDACVLSLAERGITLKRLFS